MWHVPDMAQHKPQAPTTVISNLITQVWYHTETMKLYLDNELTIDPLHQKQLAAAREALAQVDRRARRGR